MTKIESKEVVVNADAATVFNYLIDLNNFQDLLPRDNVSDFTATKEMCSFKVQGGFKIGLELQDKFPNEKIVFKSSADSPFAFTLTVFIDEQNDGKCKGYQICDADLNMMMKMMVEKPLKNLFDYIADRLVKKFV